MKNSPALSATALIVLSGCAPSHYGDDAVSAAPRTEICRPTNEQEISALFYRWNRSLQTGDPRKVVAYYAERSILLPTLSARPRYTAAEKEDYFRHFLENKPAGKIDARLIEIGCNMAVDSGLYTFVFSAGLTPGAQVRARYTFTYRWDGRQWLITSHHSSALP